MSTVGSGLAVTRPEGELQRKCESCEEEEKHTIQRKVAESGAIVAGSGHDFSKVPVFAGDEAGEILSALQPKLTIGVAGDPLEQEADRVARDVMSMSQRHPQGKVAPRPAIQTKRATGPATTVSPAMERQLESVSGGQLLPDGARAFFEPRFGHDFSAVRVHTGPVADRLNRMVNARAFTSSQHIFFREGEYNPESDSGRELLAHELTHVLHQGGGLLRKPTDCGRSSVRTPEEGGEESERQTAVPAIQADFAIAPPNPTAEAKLLTASQVAEAIKYNEIKLARAGADLIRQLRDVLGISPDPPDIDEDLANAIASWQAANNLTQDGKLGPNTAAPLFRELRAEGLTGEATALANLIRRGRVRTGPTYAPHGVVAAPAGAGRHVAFALAATFDNDPANGIFASCCEVRQEISWDATMGASFAATGNPVPHAGFPAAHPADTLIEDRDATNTVRYGHRAGFGGGVAGNRYLNAAGNLDQANGVTFDGHDDPHMFAADTGRMRFRISVIDVCNENKQIGGTDTITINW
jgi:hypothetical protein